MKKMLHAMKDEKWKNETWLIESLQKMKNGHTVFNDSFSEIGVWRFQWYALSRRFVGTRSRQHMRQKRQAFPGVYLGIGQGTAQRCKKTLWRAKLLVDVAIMMMCHYGVWDLWQLPSNADTLTCLCEEIRSLRYAHRASSLPCHVPRDVTPMTLNCLRQPHVCIYLYLSIPFHISPGLYMSIT